MVWHKPHNISGTVQCGGRLDEWCAILRELLQTDDVGMMGHFTGAITVAASSPVALVVSSGFEVHDLYACVAGERDAWLRFGQDLENALVDAGLAYSLVVHDRMVNPGATD